MGVVVSRRTVALLVALALVLAAATHPGQVALKSLVLLPNLFPNWTIKPLNWVSSEPRRETFGYDYSGGHVEVDVYHPASAGPHVFEHWFERLPGATIVVDPIRTETARAADIHLQPYPGTDAALAFVMLHVLHRDGLFDRDFIARHTIGWDELEPLLGDCTPAWGAARSLRLMSSSRSCSFCESKPSSFQIIVPVSSRRNSVGQYLT